MRYHIHKKILRLYRIARDGVCGGVASFQGAEKSRPPNEDPGSHGFQMVVLFFCPYVYIILSKSGQITTSIIPKPE